jgi:hypothetical protein
MRPSYARIYRERVQADSQPVPCCNDATLQTISHIDDDTAMLSGTKKNLTKLQFFVAIYQKAKLPRYIKCKFLQTTFNLEHSSSDLRSTPVWRERANRFCSRDVQLLQL